MTSSIQSDIAQVRSLIERRTKYSLLSGLSGVLAGCYALIGAFLCFRLIQNSDHIIYFDLMNQNISAEVFQLFAIAAVVFIAAIGTSFYLSSHKARKSGEQLLNTAAKRMIQAFLIPLVVGVIFTFILILRQEIDLIAPSSLIFYGLALVHASHYTYKEVKFLGLSEIALGIINMFFVGYGIFFWAAGFGILHIIYGASMHFKYDKEQG